MSSTRTATDDSVFHQERYASSPEFERGILAGRVAARCALLDAKADRELVWFLQYLSHQPGGLAAIVKDLVAKFPDRLQTAEMTAMGLKLGKICNAEEVKKLRDGFLFYLMDFSDAYESAAEWLLKGETILAGNIIMAKSGKDDWGNSGEYYSTPEEIKAANLRPTSIPATKFFELCRAGAGGLDSELREICLNPRRDLHARGPWCFPGLVNALREYHQQWIAEKSKVVVTTLGKKVCDALDYCAGSRSLVLLEGNARLGKSFSARAWCEQHPGNARLVEVPPGNDDASFFRALARGLGLGNFLNYKVVEIRERVESVLRAGDIVLVMDEAQRLWPQRNLRYGFPGRVVWVMTMANAGVPICLVSTPQFITAQKVMEKTGWNSAQLTGRIGHYEFLPTELTLADLTDVGRAVLPEASTDVLAALASYARVSARYLAAVDSIAKRAQFIAQRNGRKQCTAGDVRTAMQESVIPSDTMLVRTLEHAKKSGDNGRTLAAVTPPQPETESPAVARRTQPAKAVQTAFSRRADPVELVQP